MRSLCIFNKLMEVSAWKKIGVLGIIVEDMSATTQLNAILHNYADVIIGRLGVPYREKYKCYFYNNRRNSRANQCSIR